MDGPTEPGAQSLTPNVSEYYSQPQAGGTAPEPFPEIGGRPKRKIYIYIAAIVIVLGLVYIAYHEVPSIITITGGQTTTIVSATTNRTEVPIVVTDPPFGPQGTSSMVVQHSSLMVYSDGSWHQATLGGTFNVYGLTGMMQVIGNVSLSNDASISQVSRGFGVLTLGLQGASYNVFNASRQVGPALMNVTGSVTPDTVLVLVSAPAVFPIYGADNVSYLNYPSYLAVLATDPNATTYQTGTLLQESAPVRAAISAATPNIIITNASLTSSGGVTSVVAKVQNAGTAPVTLRDLLIYGNFTQALYLLPGNGNQTIIENAKIRNAGIAISKDGMLGFVFPTSQVALLELPQGTAEQAAGYTLAPGANVTLGFSSGNMTVAGGHIGLSFVPGGSYMVVVTGDRTASAERDAEAG